jgi:glycosyltransferase involved in cell wall biosynthesis
MTLKKILFISHDASRTGAPIAFLHFLRWFKQNTDVPFQVLLRRGGELESEFAELADVDVLSGSRSKVNRIFERLRFHRGDVTSKLRKKLISSNIGLVYSNTATNGDVLRQLSSLNCPIISHIHELEIGIQRFAGDGFRDVKHYTNHYIACSKAVKETLVKSHRVSENSITVVHGSIPAFLNSSHDIAAANRNIRKLLSIPSTAIIVGGSGTTDWRKGPDLFIQLARTVHDQTLDVPIYFVWVGGASHGTLEHSQLAYDMRKLGLDPYVKFLGKTSNPIDFFSAFDVFALTSREDPYPLVCLEAASLGKPILCFANAGGESEFVESDAGFIVPYLDIQRMADKVVALAKSHELRKQLGDRASQKVRERHDVSVACPKIWDVIQQVMSQSL